MAVCAAIAQVLAVQHCVMPIQKLPGLLQQGDVQRVGATQRQRQSMATQRIARGQCGELFAQYAANANPVIGCAFQKIESARRRFDEWIK